MITAVYIHVKRESGVLKVKGLKHHFRDDTAFLFRDEDQDIAKHPFVSTELKGKEVSNYRNVKVSGTSLSSYYDSKNEKFIFNGVELTKDEQDSLTFNEEGRNFLMNICTQILMFF